LVPIKSRSIFDRENDANFLHAIFHLPENWISPVAAPNAIFLLNTIYGPEEVWDKLPVEVQEDIIAKKMNFM
jgi:pyruvate-ferredoxin/flavodoxin oxidoreductase